MDIYTLLVIGHLVGTFLGVGGATLLELQLNRALADDDMSGDERAMLGLDFVTVRIGLALALFTGIGFIVFYTLSGQDFRLQNPVFWAKMLIIVAIAVNALLLQAHKISLYWGSALSFVSWWSAAILGIFLSNSVLFGFIEIMAAYTILVIGGAFMLHHVRNFVKKRHG